MGRFADPSPTTGEGGGCSWDGGDSMGCGTWEPFHLDPGKAMVIESTADTILLLLMSGLTSAHRQINPTVFLKKKS